MNKSFLAHNMRFVSLSAGEIYLNMFKMLDKNKKSNAIHYCF